MDSVPILLELLLIVLVLILGHFVVENVITVLAPRKYFPFTRHPIVSQPIEAPLKVPILKSVLHDHSTGILLQVILNPLIAGEIIFSRLFSRSM